MEDIKEIIKRKMFTCLSAINNTSNSETDNKEAEAVEHLARAYSYLAQIKEDKE